MAEIRLRNRTGKTIKAGTYVKYAPSSTSSIVPSDLSKAEVIGTVKATVGNGSIAVVELLGSTISGEVGVTSISMRKTSTHIEWKAGDGDWQTLVALTEIKGNPPVKDVDYSDGADGREVQLQTTATHIQWRYVDGTWADLIALTALKGEAGSDATVTKQAVESVLTGPITTHTHDMTSKLDATAFSGLAKITVGTTAPTNPTIGDLYIDTN